jgi:chromosome segregation ATPase
MIPENYQSPEGKQRTMQVQLSNTESSAIMAEIRSLRQEIVEDMRELGTKIDTISAGHNDLRLEVVRTTTQHETRISKIEKDVSAFWENLHKQRAELARCESVMNAHEAADKATDNTKKNTGEWARWIPGVLFGLIALGISIIGFLGGQ